MCVRTVTFEELNNLKSIFAVVRYLKLWTLLIFGLTSYQT